MELWENQRTPGRCSSRASATAMSRRTSISSGPWSNGAEKPRTCWSAFQRNILVVTSCNSVGMMVFYARKKGAWENWSIKPQTRTCKKWCGDEHPAIYTPAIVVINSRLPRWTDSYSGLEHSTKKAKNMTFCIGPWTFALILFIHLAQQLVSIDSRGTSGGMGSNQLKLTSFSRWKYILSIHESENIPIWTIYQLLPFVAKKTPLFHGQCPIFHPGWDIRWYRTSGQTSWYVFILPIYTPWFHGHFCGKSGEPIGMIFPNPLVSTVIFPIQRPASHCSAQPHHWSLARPLPPLPVGRFLGRKTYKIARKTNRA